MKMKLMAMLLIGMMIMMSIPVLTPVEQENQTASISSGNLNPVCQYVIAADQDAFVSSLNSNTNYGSDGYMWTGNDSGTPLNTWEAYIHFNLSSLPGDLQLDKVELSLYTNYILMNHGFAATGTDGFHLYFYEVSSTWDESTLTYNLRPTNDSSKVMLFQQSRMSPANPITAFPNPLQEFYCYQTFDVSPFVSRWYSGVDSNFGLVIPGTYPPHTGIAPFDDLTYTEMSFGTKEAAQFGHAPRLIITAHSIKSDVHLSYYNAFTGIGIAPYTFNVSTAIGTGGLNRTTQDITSAIVGQNLTVNVTDYFGRTLYNVTRMITNSSYFWDIALPVYSYKFTNNGDQYTRLWMYYDPAQPPYRCYIPPHETESFYLYPGWYRFAATVYDANGVTGQTYTWVRTVSDIGYVMLNGATITEVLNVANGIQATQTVITDLLLPNIIWIGYDMPVVPAGISITNSSTTIPTRIVCEANTIQVKSGNYTWFNSTAPSSTTVTTRTILYDDFYFTGNYSTNLTINNSATLAIEYHSATLPSSATLNGSDYTVDTNRTVSVTRNLGFRYSEAFSYNFYPSGHPLGSKVYEADVTVHNPSLDTTWRSVNMFVPFQNGSYADNRSLLVWDLNNSIYLTEGVHYSVSNSGVYLFFPTLSNLTWRGFRIDYTTVNDNRFPAPPHVIVTKVGDENGMTRQWQSMLWYFATASWTNTYRESYSGPLYIEMQTSIAMDSTQDVIVQTSTGFVVTTAIISGNTITIPSITLAVGESISYTILFKSSMGAGGAADWSFAGIPIWVYASIVGIMTFFIAIFLKYSRKNDKDGNVILTISIIAWLIDFLLIVSSFVLR